MANQREMNSSKKKRQLPFGIAHRMLGSVADAEDMVPFLAGRILTPPKSSPHQPSQIGAGQQDDTTFPNFLTDPCQRA
jgi:hypothetical protein